MGQCWALMKSSLPGAHSFPLCMHVTPSTTSQHRQVIFHCYHNLHFSSTFYPKGQCCSLQTERQILLLTAWRNSFKLLITKDNFRLCIMFSVKSTFVESLSWNIRNVQRGIFQFRAWVDRYPSFCAGFLHAGEFSLWFTFVMGRIQGAHYSNSVGPVQQKVHKMKSEKQHGFQSTR